MLTIVSAQQLKDILDVAKSNDVPEIVLFGASWDVNTTRLFPIIDLLPPNRVGTVYVDVDVTPGIAISYSTRQIPMLRLFRNGILVKQLNGNLVQSEADLYNFIKE